MTLPQQILEQYWGHQQFRPLQAEIISDVLNGTDVLALLPTGGGKSVCFQVPALIMNGLCLVISPLIALMKDQVENLKKKNLSALSIHSGMTYNEVKETLQTAAYGNVKFLYVSPERLETALFKEYAPALGVQLIAVDEAHCISQWGYDFRPPYLRIAQLRQQYPRVPILALTASATPEVQKDICSKLRFTQYRIHRQSFEKPNLSFSIFYETSKINKLIEMLDKVPGSAIIYCRNRRRTKEFAQLLVLNNIAADYYHAGLEQAERNQKQEDWLHDKTRVIVCTNAFGMGIDKPAVRLVVHLDIPENLESYYQEAGRAGRDGRKAYAVMLYNNDDLETLVKLPDIKFPSFSTIQQVYQSVANYLQVPVGSGAGQYYNFDPKEMAARFSIDIITLINALKALEQEGHLVLNEQVFVPVRIVFNCNKEQLNDFLLAQPDLEHIIKTLLRLYAGIFEHEVSISEKQLQLFTRTSIETIRQQLLRLQAFGIIKYYPQKEGPQLYYLLNRAPAEYLTFNTDSYTKRKVQYTARVTAMQTYISMEKECRSQYIGHYFGDKKIAACGVCDNCLNQKNRRLSSDEFSTISAAIVAYLATGPKEVPEILRQLNAYKKEKIWQVINYLQAEGRVRVNDGGLLHAQS